MRFGMAPERARHVGLDKNDLLMEVAFAEVAAPVPFSGLPEFLVAHVSDLGHNMRDEIC